MNYKIYITRLDQENSIKTTLVCTTTRKSVADLCMEEELKATGKGLVVILLGPCDLVEVKFGLAGK